MRYYQAYDAKENNLSLPILFRSRMQAECEEFLANYDPKVGFLIAKSAKGFFLFMGGYQYKLGFFERGYTPVAFTVLAKDGVSQKSSVTIATEAIRISGLPKEYIMLWDNWRDFQRRHPKHSFPVSLMHLDELFDAETEDAPFNPDPKWKKLLDISSAKEAFASHFLIQWPYLNFTQGEKVEDGYQCIFQIAPPDETIRKNEQRFDAFRKDNNIIDEDKQTDDSSETLRETYINTLNAGSIVEIPLNRPPDAQGRQPMLYATVVRAELPGVTHTEQGEPIDLPDSFYEQDAYFSQPWTMVLSFKDDSVASVKDIPEENGVIAERISTDYQHYKTALEAMTSRTANQSWAAAEQVLVHYTTTPPTTEIEPEFTSTTLNDNQKQAIRMALNAQDFLLIQGPPGSGKTTIIAEMVRNFVTRGQRVLVCSKGNLAVDNVLEKWIEENKERSDGHLCVRLGDRFKLDFLKDYTPAQVTARVQAKAHTKTKQERDVLISRIQGEIRTVEENRAVVDKLAALCIAACELAQTLHQLCEAYTVAIRCYRQNAGVLQQKYGYAKQALSVICQSILMPIYSALCRDQISSPQQLDRYDACCQETARLISASLAEFTPGFFARLFAGPKANTWKPLEQQLRQYATTFFGFGIHANQLQNNPLLSVESLHLPAFTKAPSIPQIKNAVIAYRAALTDFTRKEALRLNRIRIVLNDWLVELGSGVSSPLEKNVVLNSIPVIGSTCMGILSDSDFKNLTYDVVIVDEAGQIPIFDILVPIIKAKKVILIGDHLQLPPMDENDFARYYAVQKTGSEKGEAFLACREEVAGYYNVSLFEELFKASDLESSSIMLDTQYRMHPDICSFISDNFYNGKYLPGVSADKRTLQISDFDKPIYFYDTCNLPADQRQETDHNPGYSNATEAELLSDILLKLILAIREGSYTGAELVQKDKEGNITGYDIGVISGYKKQVKAISTLTLQKLEQYMSPEEAKAHMDRFMISSVDSFQGRDNQIILFSMTRSNKEGKIGFLKDVRRLNVAMTRAKSLLIMVGDSATLTACNADCAHDPETPVAQIYRNLVTFCKEHNYYHPMKGEESHGTE